MNFYSLIFLLCLTVLAFGRKKKWHKPIKLESETNSSIGIGLFMSSVEKSYILYSRPEPNNKTQELLVATYDWENLTLCNSSILSDDRLYFSGDIEGSYDGEQLLVAQCASRNKVSEFPVNGSSFYNIFLSNSSSSNASWSNESAIDEGSEDASIARIHPVIVAVEEVGQLYLFYRNIYSNNTTSLAMIKFDPEKKTLTDDEHIIANDWEPPYVFSASYTYTNNSLTLHVVYTGKDHKIVYLNSTDGKDWSPCDTLKNVTLGSNLLSLASDTHSLPTALFLAYRSTDNITYMQISKDAGQTWAQPVKVGKKEVDSFSLTICGDEYEQAAFLLTSKAGKLKLSMYEVDDDELDKVKAPFKGMKIEGETIRCLKKGKYYKLLALGTDIEDTVAYVTAMNLKD